MEHAALRLVELSSQYVYETSPAGDWTLIKNDIPVTTKFNTFADENKINPVAFNIAPTIFKEGLPGNKARVTVIHVLTASTIPRTTQAELELSYRQQMMGVTNMVLPPSPEAGPVDPANVPTGLPAMPGESK